MPNEEEFCNAVAKQELSYDAWGRLRNPVTQVAYTSGSEPALFLGRGYTGHELLPWFGLVNMNARLYDAALGRFLSPDPYVQAPNFTQNFNRYSYCLNNPLVYVDETGEFIWIIPNISWSKKGGLSIGVSVIVGIPGVASAQAGIGYNFKGNDFNAYAGATAAFNTAYASYSTGSGFSVGWSAGLSPQLGFPISSNITSVGANYNFSNEVWSGNVSAWTVDKTGWAFDPSVSAMIFPERTTNFVRGQGFRNNNQVLERFVGNGQQQRALKYFGFKGTYIDSDEQSSFWFNRKTGENGINFRNGAFESYEALLSTYTKESFHMNRFKKSGVSGFDQGDTDLWQYGRDPEERLGVIHQYKNRGLYSKDKYNYYSTITSLENSINNWYSYGIYNTPYNFTPFQKRWWHFIYKIPRKW